MPLIVSKVKIMRFYLLIQNPCVGRASVKERANLLWWVVPNINISHIREIQMVIKMQAKTSAPLLTILVELTLIHVLVLEQEVFALSWTLLHHVSLFDGVPHILGKEVIVKVLLPPFENDSGTCHCVCL